MTRSLSILNTQLVNSSLGKGRSNYRNWPMGIVLSFYGVTIESHQESLF